MEAEFLKRLYFEMLRIRLVEEKIAKLYPEQEMRCPVHLCIGQEAVPVGVCASLSSDDYIMSTHRSHGHYLAKDGDLKAMMAEFYGKSGGCCQGKGGSMHLIDLSVGFLGATPIVGSTIPISVGAALGSLMQDDKRVAVAFFGDAAVEEGVFHESLNFALVKGLPVIFVCENNFYSVYSPISVRQPKCREIFSLAKGHGMESYQGDGNDVIEVYKLAEKAINRARRGGGPTFLEFKTYRWREHCGPNYDNQLGYRTEREFRQWEQRCPIEMLKRRLLRDGVLRNSDIKDMEILVEAEIEEAVVFANESPFPKDKLLWEHVYAP